jgi:hypothetical protein
MGALRVSYQREGGLHFEFAGQQFCHLDETPAPEPGDSISARLVIDPDEHFYGFGERTACWRKPAAA